MNKNSRTSFVLEPMETSDMNWPGLKEFQNWAAGLPVRRATPNAGPWTIARTEYINKMEALLAHVRVVISDRASLFIASDGFCHVANDGWSLFHLHGETHETIASMDAFTGALIRIGRDGKVQLAWDAGCVLWSDSENKYLLSHDLLLIGLAPVCIKCAN